MKNRDPILSSLLRTHLAWVLFITSSIAVSDEFHYKNILIGDRAAGLAGAFTAVSDDASGMFYNPAGMVFGFENYISISANTYNTSQTRYQSVIGGQDYVLNSKGLVASYFGFSQSVGKSKIAFGIGVPNSDLLDQDDEIDTSTGTIKRRYFQQDTTYLFGGAYSTAVNDSASVGFTLLGVYRPTIAIDNQLGLSSGGSYIIVDQYTRRYSYGILPKLGFQYMASPTVSTGIVVSKNINFHGSQNIRSQFSNQTTPTGNYSSDFTTTNRTTDLGSPSPWTIETGIAYFPSRRFLVSLDLDYYSKDSSSSNDFTVSSTWNGSLGSEYYLTDSLVIRGGIFTNNANTPSVSANLLNQSTHVNLLGGSLALSFVRPSSSFTIGTIYSHGSGEGQILTNQPDIQMVSQYNLDFYISGSYQL